MLQESTCDILKLGEAAMKKKILVVDNEIHSRELIALFLCEANYEVRQAADGVSAIRLLEQINFDLMICDIVMPRLGAFDLIDHMGSLSLSTPVILITGYPDILTDRCISHLPYFSKPFNMYDLLHKVRALINAR